MSISCSQEGMSVLIQSIGRLLVRRPDIMKALFDSSFSELRSSPKNILKSFRGLSHGEYLSVQVALDLWSGQGGANLRELLDTWDDEQWAHFVSALGILLLNPKDI
jgi:hypothetical protein